MTSIKLIEYAFKLASEIQAQGVLIYADVAKGFEGIESLSAPYPFKVILALRASELSGLEDTERVSYITVPNAPMTRLGQVKVALLVALARGTLNKGDKVVLLTGVERSKVIDTIMVLNLETESELLSISDPVVLCAGVQHVVFERVLSLAAQLAFEGREGRKIGTIFVLGDEEVVLTHSQNLVLNPFYGYAPAQRNILNIQLEETIKEFALIDGAFVISGDGLVETAGARLLGVDIVPGLPPGLGTRHAAAASITAVSKSIALCISQSTGTLSIFRGGKLIAQLPVPSPERQFSGI